ncbi:hypothetical protein L6R50_14800 [Myxococcota bacterium]|nr:hypothetical protein [Myxococcota bacterium]
MDDYGDDDYGEDYGDDYGDDDVGDDDVGDDDFGARRRRRRTSRRGSGGSRLSALQARLKRRARTQKLAEQRLITVGPFQFTADGSLSAATVVQGPTLIKSVRSVVTAGGGATGGEVVITDMSAGRKQLLGNEGELPAIFLQGSNNIGRQLSNFKLTTGQSLAADMKATGIGAGESVDVYLIFEAYDLAG